MDASPGWIFTATAKGGMQMGSMSLERTISGRGRLACERLFRLLRPRLYSSEPLWQQASVLIQQSFFSVSTAVLQMGGVPVHYMG